MTKDEINKKMEQYRNDPVLFAKEVLGIELHDYQIDMCRFVKPCRLINYYRDSGRITDVLSKSVVDLK